LSNHLDQTDDQALIALGTQGPTQPQAGADHERHRQPDYVALHFDQDFISLRVFQVSGLLYKMLMHTLTMCPAAPLPLINSPFI
jgi:hypothetical protein